MIKINPQPEIKPESNIKELGFSQKAFTGLLISAGILSAEETVVHWKLERDFLAFDVKKTMNLTDKQLALILEWFGTAQDLAHGQYLKDDDYVLARLIFVQLGRRVPKSIWKNKEKP